MADVGAGGAKRNVETPAAVTFSSARRPPANATSKPYTCSRKTVSVTVTIFMKASDPETGYLMLLRTGSLFGGAGAAGVIPRGIELMAEE